MTIFYFIRHGDTDAVGKTLVGRLPGVHLNPEGKAQALRAAEIMDSVQLDLLFTSPLERTMETASLIAERQNLEPVICEALNEISCGDWSGAPFEKLVKDEAWLRFNRFRSTARIPGGELAVEVQCRVISKIEEWRNRYPAKKVAAVSHGDVIKSALMHFTGMPIDFIHRIRINTASITAIAVSEYGAEVLFVNYTGSMGNI